ncbi:alpha/beta fold hydrolase [Tautonia plasticadhaerens]|uniref:Lipase 3 n=1 Tax=Tautonia plasticadhaerens TaxID=2527974 RepID=A0A518HC07_9BACT|nr:alpha/beta hydrolase [Tautonia plasticadhaerens]QDV38394.1 Lipase 3 precursor [Tautonia plasticadhaerens]
MMPVQILGIWFRGLFSFAALGLAAYLLYRGFEEVRDHPDPPPDRPELAGVADGTDTDARGEEGEHRARVMAYFIGGGTLLALSLLGGPGLVPLLLARGGGAGPEVSDGETHRLARPDGSELHVVIDGPPDAPTIVLTHGWGANRDEWLELRHHLAGRFRLIMWDLPGLGRSKRPDNRDYRLETLAGHLDAVVELAGGRPVVLLGHSIGGMITLTYCQQFPGAIGPKVAGLVLVHTTYTNPVRTTKNAPLYTALEKPLIVPLLHLTIALSPLVWLMNWMSYLNGTLHLSTARQSFAGRQSREQLERATRFAPHGSPAVLARGMFGMLRYDATASLRSIAVPALVVAGDRDPILLPEASERIRDGIPDSRLETLAPARHMGLMEHHERFAREVAAFVEATAGAAGAGPASRPTSRQPR